MSWLLPALVLVPAGTAVAVLLARGRRRLPLALSVAGIAALVVMAARLVAAVSGGAVVVTQVALGGWVSSNYAALACADFPTCFGTYAPTMDVAHGFNIFQGIGPNYLGGLMHNEARVAIHWFHRLGALVVLLVVGALILRLWSRNPKLAVLTGGILLVQLLLGTLNVVWSLPLAVATAHNGVGALLLLAMVTVNFAPPKDAR